jgi:PTS system nitrogen regulatory IIA component
MEMAELIEPDRVIIGLHVPDKPRLLGELARRAALALGIDAASVLEALSQREELGSTGIGQGVAIPHARVEGLPHSFGLFARLERPVDFAAIDAQPVDLVFLLLTRTDAGKEHLAALACISRRLRDHDVTAALRAAKDGRGLYDHLTGAAAMPR